MASLSFVVRDALFIGICSTASVRLATMSLSYTIAIERFLSAPTISCIAFAVWNPDSPLVTLLSYTRS